MGEALVLATAPEGNDAVIAAGGAPAGLAGLILVFLGESWGMPLSTTRRRLLTPYRKSTGAILGVFAVDLSTTAMSVAWLTTGGGRGPLYDAVLWGDANGPASVWDGGRWRAWDIDSCRAPSRRHAPAIGPSAAVRRAGAAARADRRSARLPHALVHRVDSAAWRAGASSRGDSR